VSPLLEVEGLRVQFGAPEGVAEAVDGISFSLDAGQTLALVGGAGSGKTVASLALLALPPGRGARVSGQIRFKGRDLLGLPRRELSRIRGEEVALVVGDQSSSLHPFYRVGAQLVETIVAHRPVSKAAARDRAIDLLELVGIPDPHRCVDQYPDELSPSTRQRAMIGMALANEPELLIADEPTGRLDSTERAEILELLRRAHERLGTAIVIVCREPALAAEIAGEICVMYAGRIVERAPADLILESPQHPYTWALLSSTGPAPVPGSPPSPVDPPSGCLFHPRCPYVRDEHRRVVPALEPVPGQSGHEVACLLSPEERTAIWRGLRELTPPPPPRTGIPSPAPARADPTA
jgi:peptide/nickel transport system ATP-binding protein